MREYRDTGLPYTSTWTADRFDPDLIWRQAMDRLHGRIEGVPHHFLITADLARQR
jgi:hypothetical protein